MVLGKGLKTSIMCTVGGALGLGCRTTVLDNRQCWGKLLLKVMHYNIALLPKKITNYVT